MALLRPIQRIQAETHEQFYVSARFSLLLASFDDSFIIFAIHIHKLTSKISTLCV